MRCTEREAVEQGHVVVAAISRGIKEMPSSYCINEDLCCSEYNSLTLAVTFRNEVETHLKVEQSLVFVNTLTGDRGLNSKLNNSKEK